MKLRNIIILNIFCILIASNTYSELTQSTYKPLDISSEINLQVTFYNNSSPLLGIQWWVSDNLQLSGNIYTETKPIFNLYNNLGIGYYNENIKWLYSSSNFIELSLHKIKYKNSYPRWINFSYKSRYNLNNFILGYDLVHCFWKDVENNFISLIIAYNIKNKIILEFKFDLINKNSHIGSVNFSIPI